MKINKAEAMKLADMPLEELCAMADRVRKTHCGSTFDICTIVNAKSGRCSEDCKYCAQSAHFHTNVTEYPLLSTEELLKEASVNAEMGVLRYSIVTSGKRLSDSEISGLCESIAAIRREVNIEICVSAGLLDKASFIKLKEAGVSRAHCNLETSRKFFPHICTTHTYDEKIETVKAAMAAGLSVCSGGIMGLGETMEDRIDMALQLRELGITSVPVNFLNPIPGTPLQNSTPLSDDTKRRIIAVYRMILPHSSIRLAGGRGGIDDKGLKCFMGGANAAISGHMLTTAGITVDADLKMIDELGFKAGLWNG